MMKTKSSVRTVPKKTTMKLSRNHSEASNTEIAWESRALGAEHDYVQVASTELESRVEAALGLQMISIRLPKDLIETLKLIAKYRGTGYQPLMRDVLNRFAASELKTLAQEVNDTKHAKAAVSRALQNNVA